jgi:hypothetical protein
MFEFLAADDSVRTSLFVLLATITIVNAIWRAAGVLAIRIELMLMTNEITIVPNTEGVAMARSGHLSLHALARYVLRSATKHLTAPSHRSRSIVTGGRDGSARVDGIAGMQLNLGSG